MKRIENLKQLQAEKERLKALSKVQEQKLKDDLQNIKEEFTPLNIILKAVASVTGIKVEGKEFMKEGFALGFSLLFKRLILKAEKKVEEKIYSFFDFVVEGLKKILSKVVDASERRNERMDEEGNT